MVFFFPSGIRWPYFWLLFNLYSLFAQSLCWTRFRQARIVGQRGLWWVWRVHSLSPGEGMPKPAQSRREVFLLCIWLTILEVMKRSLCPPGQQLGLHSISRLFILAYSQGYIVFPLCLFDSRREVGRGISWGRSVISFVFTLKGLLRVL